MSKTYSKTEQETRNEEKTKVWLRSDLSDPYEVIASDDMIHGYSTTQLKMIWLTVNNDVHFMPMSN